MIALYELNEMPVEEFVTTLGGLFGHSAWVARRVVQQRPFESRFELLEAMCAAVAQASTDEQLSLIRTHPQLTEKVGARAPAEQQARLRALNVQYLERFDFPFVFSAQGHEAAFAIAELERRVLNDPDTERREALAQIGRIASFKLAELIDEAAGAQILAMAERLTKPAEQRLSEMMRDWMLAAGLEAELDVSGNLIGRMRGEDAGADVLVAGACLCRYDGWLGILLPIVVAARLRREEVRLPFTLQIVACADAAAPAHGGFTDAVEASAAHAVVAQAHHSPRVLGFVEVALETGHVLRNEDVPLAVATSMGERQCAPDMQELWADSIRQMTGIARPLHISSEAHSSQLSPASNAPVGGPFSRVEMNTVSPAHVGAPLARHVGARAVLPVAVSGLIVRRSSDEPGLHAALSPQDAELAARTFLSFLTSFMPPD